MSWLPVHGSTNLTSRCPAIGCRSFSMFGPKSCSLPRRKPVIPCPPAGSGAVFGRIRFGSCSRSEEPRFPMEVADLQ